MQWGGHIVDPSVRIYTYTERDSHTEPLFSFDSLLFCSVHVESPSYNLSLSITLSTSWAHPYYRLFSTTTQQTIDQPINQTDTSGLIYFDSYSLNQGKVVPTEVTLGIELSRVVPCLQFPTTYPRNPKQTKTKINLQRGCFSPLCSFRFSFRRQNRSWRNFSQASTNNGKPSAATTR